MNSFKTGNSNVMVDRTWDLSHRRSSLNHWRFTIQIYSGYVGVCYVDIASTLYLPGTMNLP